MTKDSINKRNERAAPGLLVSSLLNQPVLLSRSAMLSKRPEPSTNCNAQSTVHNIVEASCKQRT